MYLRRFVPRFKVVPHQCVTSISYLSRLDYFLTSSGSTSHVKCDWRAFFNPFFFKSEAQIKTDVTSMSLNFDAYVHPWRPTSENMNVVIPRALRDPYCVRLSFLRRWLFWEPCCTMAISIHLSEIRESGKQVWGNWNRSRIPFLARSPAPFHLRFTSSRKERKEDSGQHTIAMYTPISR